MKQIIIKKLDDLIKELQNQILIEEDEDGPAIRNELYDSFYLTKENGRWYLIDESEESYYEDWMLERFDDILREEDSYLECVCPGRYIIAE